jgi:hypothetical protein
VGLVQVRRGYGPKLEVSDVTCDYLLDGQVKQVIDANGSHAEMR